MKKTFIIGIIALLFLISCSQVKQVTDSKVIIERVTFQCEGSEIAGNLYTSAKLKGKKLPAIIVVPPATGIKEQVAGTYAEKLAEKGYITLAFDHRTYGESEGEPRSSENLFMKTEDIRSAISFMRSLKQVKKNQVGAVGICGGASYLVETAIGDSRIKALATISGTLSYKGLIASYGGEALLSMAGDARQKYDETGETTYIQIINNPADETNVFANEAYEYYVGNQSKYPAWKNQVDVSSFSNLAALDIKEVVSSLKKPILFIAGSKAMTASLSQIAFDNTPDSKTKELYWVDGATHISLYHDDNQINEVCNKLDEFFDKSMKPKRFKNMSQNIQKSLIRAVVGLTYEAQQEEIKVKDTFLKETNDDKVITQKVTFKNLGTIIVGNLYIPVGYEEGEKLPGIIMVTPATGVKEQVAGDYAYRLAEKGFITLAFDHRTYGESEGVPRSSEDILIKSEDIKSAVSFMCSLEQIDKDKVGAVGICGGAGFLVETAPGDRRIKAIGTISGTLSSKKVIEDMPGSELIISLSNDAKQDYDETGKVTYMRIFAKKRPKLSNKESKRKLSKFQQEAYEYYVENAKDFPTWRPDVYLGTFSNIAAFDIPTAVEAINPIPVLFIAGTEAYTAPLSQNAYDVAKGSKELFWIEGATHVSLYYVKEYMDQVSDKLEKFFNEKL